MYQVVWVVGRASASDTHPHPHLTSPHCTSIKQHTYNTHPHIHTYIHTYIHTTLRCRHMALIVGVFFLESTSHLIDFSFSTYHYCIALLLLLLFVAEKRRESDGQRARSCANIEKRKHDKFKCCGLRHHVLHRTNQGS